MWKTAEIASWALYMSPGDNTAVMNSETKQTKRGRLKQEAQHRYCFATPWYHRRPCSELWEKKTPDSHAKVQIIHGRVYKDTSQPERNTYISAQTLFTRCWVIWRKVKWLGSQNFGQSLAFKFYKIWTNDACWVPGRLSSLVPSLTNPERTQAAQKHLLLLLLFFQSQFSSWDSGTLRRKLGVTRAWMSPILQVPERPRS